VLSGLRRLKARVVRRRAARRAAVGLVGPEAEEFLVSARRSFVRLQQAWDAADLDALASFTAEPLWRELREELAARGPSPNRTDVLTLDARLVGVEDLREAYVASVEFSGLIRERADAGATPFRELWMLANVKRSTRGWLLTRVQALA
jgi:predicted lipid-binding transport protein (Tim44 family)